VRGLGFSKLDFSLMKNFGLPKEDRVKLQLRGETNDALDLVNPNGVASTNITSTSFGQIGSFREARVMQIGAKLLF
jgi:hypothetical protein